MEESLPEKLCDKSELLVMSSLGSHCKCAFYGPENKSITFVITEKVCVEMVLYLCQTILKQRS